MSQTLNLGVEKDHIESITKASGMTAICELIWNSLDADASEIHVEYKPTTLGGYQYIKVKDNGHGLAYPKAKDVFSTIGGSEKKTQTQSPSGRLFHGKEGKGRYKSLSLGDLVTFKSTYQFNGGFSQFTTKIDRNHLSKTEISDLHALPKGTYQSGFEVEINNVNDKNAYEALAVENRKEIAEKFASYWLNYPKFKIFFNGNELMFDSLFKNQTQKEFRVNVNESLSYKFTLKIIEWTFENKKKTYLCNLKGIPFLETNLGIRSPIPISIFVQSTYIEKLHRENSLKVSDNFDYTIQAALKEAKDFARDYVRQRLHVYSKEFIDELKSKDLYPYKDKADSIIEESKRQVFDIVALQVNEHLPSFSEQDDRSKKLTLVLISEALEHDASNLKRILTEVIGLPEDKRNELSELLEDTSLSNIIDTMAIIKNRLHFLNGLEQMIYNDEVSQSIKERKHLHKIIVRETWIFGDEYAYGVDDVTLQNVLKTYLKEHLNREDYEEIIESEDNPDLNVIPDVCLWQQFSMGSAGKENLVIELKRPTVDAGLKEKGQIEGYASSVSRDARFPKDKTKWKFILVTRNVKDELIPSMTQKNRKYGHISEGDNCDVFILTWGDIINEAKTRYEFIKEKLNLNLKDNEQGLNYLKSKYKEYLPGDFAE